MTIGVRLREARQRQDLSLHDISQRTNIPAHVLEAIERDDFAAIPGGLFVRAYLRAYSRQVGLEPEAAVAEYRAEHEEQSQDTNLEELRARYPGGRHSGGAWLQWAILVAALAGLAYAVRSTDPADQQVRAPVLEPLKPVAADETPVREAPSLARAAVPAESDGLLRLEVQPAGPCWVSARSDGRLAIYRLMQPGELATIEARQEIMLRVGDAGVFGYWLNGVEGKPLGGHGEPVTIQLTADNYGEYLTAAPTSPVM